MTDSPNILNYPGAYNISFLELDSNDVTVSLKDVFLEVSIYENLFKPTLSIDITLTDTNNLPLYMPITGEETLRVGFNTPSQNDPFDGSNLAFRIYSMTNRKNTNDREQIYTLHGISEHFMISEQQKISKSYSKLKGHEIVKKVYENFVDPHGFRNLKTDDPTDNNIDCVIPSWTPLQTIKWISERSISAKNKQINYVFYESIRDGFVFESLSSLTQKDSVEKLEHGVVLNEDKSSKNLKKVENYSYIGNFNHLINGKRGMVRSNLVTHDIVNKKIEETEINVVDNFSSTNHLAPVPLILQKAPDVNYGENKDIKKSFYPKHTGLFDSMGSDNLAHLWKMQREGQMQEWNNIRISIMIPGNSNISVGDVVEYTIPSPEFIGEKDINTIDNMLSGKFLVTGIRHIIQPDVYKMAIEITKDSFEQDNSGEDKKSTQQRLSPNNFNTFFRG